MCFVSIMNGFSYRIPSRVRQVLFSGEVMPIKHLMKWKSALPHARFVNLYGPTEITCNCTYAILPDRDFAPDESLPIGRAFPNEKVFLLDENRQGRSAFPVRRLPSATLLTLCAQRRPLPRIR